MAYQQPPGQVPPPGYPPAGPAHPPAPPGYQQPGGFYQQPYPAPARGPRVWLWVLGGCAGVFLLGVIGVVALFAYGFTELQKGQSGALNCLPADFPKHSNQHLLSFNNYAGTNASVCRMSFDDDSEASVVSSYYAAELNTGDWVVTKTDSVNGTFSFRRRSNPRVHGTLAVLGRGQRSIVQIELTTDR